jgi:hypothetical protein
MTINEAMKRYVSEEMCFTKGWLESLFRGKKTSLAPMLATDLIDRQGGLTRVVIAFDSLEPEKKYEMLEKTGFQVALSNKGKVVLLAAWISEGWVKQFNRREELKLRRVSDYEDKMEAVVVGVSDFRGTVSDLLIFPIERDEGTNITLGEVIMPGGTGENNLLFQFFRGFALGMMERCPDRDENTSLLADSLLAWYERRDTKLN